MVCPNCTAENKPGRKFCVRCATPLATACPSCGAPYEPGDLFCGECATPLTPGGAPRVPATTARARVPSPAVAPVAERRLVSVLFADLVGFTPFAEERDAEDVRDTLTRYFELASDVIGRYGGTVEKFIGDAVMAVWGAPAAREDDAERAVRAAMELVDAVRALGPAIQARAGVLTGEAAVRVGAANQGMVAGDLVNTASRLQSVAPPGAVLVGEATMRATSAAIAFEEAGPQVLKGKTSPVPAWRAVRVVAERGGRGRSDLPEPPFVGRDEELRLLKALIATTGRDRRARLVSITGPGGIGKSRLAWELEKYADGIDETIFWHRGRSPAYGEGITFWALGEMIRQRAGLAETDDDATTRERIAATVADFVPDEDDRRWVEPALLTLLGLEPAPPGGRDVLFAAWRILFERIAERGTTVLLFEDLQWADSGLLDFIEHLLEWSRSSPLLIATLARPELLDRRPDWGAEIRHLTRLALEPLPDEAMRALLDGFVPGLPERAVAAILARADGIPLYAVETVRSLVSEGRLVRDGGVYRPAGELGELAIPDTLRSLIASRLDALDPADRDLVSDAAVLGQSFSLAGLSAVAGREPAELEPRLRLLVRRELFDLAVDPRSPERGQYRFVQSLIREVAYGTLSRRERRARHLAAARYFEALGDDELAGALASHYVAAHEASADGAEADAVAIQARIALSSAAARAVTLGAHGPAVAYLRQAIAITADPAERGELLLRAAASANAAARHDEAAVFATEAVEVGQAGGDASAVGAARALLGEILIDDGRPREAAELLAAAAADIRPSMEGSVLASILSNLSRARMRTGAFADAVRAADEALDLAEHLGLERLVAETFNNKGSSLGLLGRRREAIALLGAAVDLANRGGFVAAEVRARSNLAGYMDDARDQFEAYRAAGDLARRVGIRSLMLWAVEAARVGRYVLAEDWDAAIAEGEDGDEAGDVRARSALDEVRRLSISALMLVARGDPTDDLLTRLEAVSSQSSDPFAAASVHGMRSDRAFVVGDYVTAYEEAMLAADDPQIGTFYLDRAARAAIAAGDLPRAREALERLEADPLTEEEVETSRIVTRAGVAALEGRRAEAAAGYLDALVRCRVRSRAFVTARYGLELVRLMGPDEPAVRAVAEEARAIFERAGARPYLEALDAALAAEGVDGPRAPGGSRGRVAAGATGAAPAAEDGRP